ncbi:MAG: hypothetical protein AB7I19_03945 [Planctomycetota bacterium]
MKWFLAALAFSSLVALAIVTAAVSHANVKRRAALARLDQRVLAQRVHCEAEAVRFAQASKPEVLCATWRRMEAIMARRAAQ